MKAGDVLSGKYRLLSLLGEGGMGAVWRAEDLRLAAPVAIKLMHPEDAGSEELRRRFDAEARTAAKLRSPHVAQIFDVGSDEQVGVSFIVMELLEGETLRERLKRAGPLPAPEVGTIVAHVARALTRAHALGIVHRDLKPENIFLCHNGDGLLAKVIDFGIAKRASKSMWYAPTATGILMGTPIYMSPEQIQSSRKVDARSDLWSLGVIAVECLTGRLPFEADHLPGLALLISQGRATAPSQLGPVPDGVDQWFRQATSVDPSDRFSSAASLAEKLAELCGVSPSPLLQVTGRSASPPQAEPIPPTQPYAPQASTSMGPVSRTSPVPQQQAPGRARRSSLPSWRIPALVVSLLGATGAVWSIRQGSVWTTAAGRFNSAGALPATAVPPSQNPATAPVAKPAIKIRPLPAETVPPPAPIHQERPAETAHRQLGRLTPRKTEPQPPRTKAAPTTAVKTAPASLPSPTLSPSTPSREVQPPPPGLQPF
jgi:serine/threonine protein kinase